MRALLFRAKPERAQAPNPSTERDCCEFLRFITPQPPLIHPRQLSTTAPRDSHRPTDARATTSIHLPPFSTSIRNGRRQGYELAQSEDSVIVLLLTHLQERAAAERLAASRAVERLERLRSLTLRRPDSRYALPYATCIAHTITCHAEAGAPQSTFGGSVADARCATLSGDVLRAAMSRVIFDHLRAQSTQATSLIKFIVPMRSCQAFLEEPDPEQDARWSQGRRLCYRRPGVSYRRSARAGRQRREGS